MARAVNRQQQHYGSLDEACAAILHLDPATRTVIAGGESFVLERSHFALYWMIAERCTGKRAGVHISDPNFGPELLAYYRRLVNVDRGVSEQIEKAYDNFTKDNFDPAKSHVNLALRRALGERRSRPYLIAKLEQIAGTRYHRFGLLLPPEAITIAASLPVSRVRAAKSNNKLPKTIVRTAQ